MTVGIFGRKVGMTQLYDSSGRLSAVTVIRAEPNVVVMVRTPEKDGYCALQVGFGRTKAKRLTKPVRRHLEKRDLPLMRSLREIRLKAPVSSKPGETLTVAQFEVGQFVDVVGTSKGKGFQGVIKKHNFAGQAASHGSEMHRRVGAVGQRSTPGRVFKNQGMPGRLGGERVTVQNLVVAKVWPEEHLLAVKGAVPGPVGGLLLVRPAVKKTVAAA
jgi:large subunit ribosomal protein L3